jgi:hypothetical protein
MLESASQAVHRPWLDGLGAMVSVACAVQCAALPVLVTVLPFPVLAGVLRFIPPVLRPGSGFDRIALTASVALAVVSFSAGISPTPPRSGFRILTGRSVHDRRRLAVGAGRYQLFFVVAGALVLAAGQIFNRRLCARHRFCHVAKLEMVLKTSALKRTST